MGVAPATPLQVFPTGGRGTTTLEVIARRRRRWSRRPRQRALVRARAWFWCRPGMRRS